MNSSDGFVEVYVPGKPMLVLLHGTGGNEREFLEFGKMLMPGAGFLSLLGKEIEGGGVTRWFQRRAEGVFDMENLLFRARELADYVVSRLPAATRIGVGFSNGANMASTAMLLRPEAFAGVALFSPMVAYEPDPMPNLDGKPVLIVSGQRDMMVPVENAERLARLFQAAKADVNFVLHPGGHNPTPDTVRLAATWLSDHFGSGASQV